MSDLIAGRIDLLDPLARGASGTLWRAVDRRLEAVCAAKVMRQRDGAEVLRFVREQSVGGSGAQGLRSHPHLLPPYTWVAEDDAVVLAMPLLHGGTLAQAIADHGALHPSLVAELTAQLLDALAALHASGWLHRDVKPANLLLEVTGREAPHLRLADFGIALHEGDARLTATGVVHGTPGFMSPELLRGEISAAQDVWAAGAVAVQALAPGTELTGTEAPESLREVLAGVLAGDADPVADALRAAIATMLDPDPQERPSAAAARDALPRPTGPAEGWVLTEDGEPFEVFDLLDPLPDGSPAAGLPLVPPDGPHGLTPRPRTLHERITGRAEGRPSAPAPSTPTTADEVPAPRPTLALEAQSDVAPGATIAPSPAHDPARGHRSPAVPLLVLLAVIAIGAAVTLGALAARAPSAEPGGTTTPSATPTSTSAPSTGTTTGAPATATAAMGDACAWSQEGEHAAAPDGADLTCVRQDDDTYLWEDR